jgi:hypothetical protein
MQGTAKPVGFLLRIFYDAVDGVLPPVAGVELLGMVQEKAAQVSFCAMSYEPLIAEECFWNRGRFLSQSQRSAIEPHLQHMYIVRIEALKQYIRRLNIAS